MFLKKMILINQKINKKIITSYDFFILLIFTVFVEKDFKINVL